MDLKLQIAAEIILAQQIFRTKGDLQRSLEQTGESCLLRFGFARGSGPGKTCSVIIAISPQLPSCSEETV